MTDITYDTDACATPATLGWDVVRFYEGKAHRMGTYGSPKKAFAEKHAVEDLYFGSVEVIAR